MVTSVAGVLGRRGVLGVLYRCFLEARPVVQGVFLLRFLAGASFAGPLFSDGANLRLWGGAALCVCATLSVYIINGVMDIEEDRVNGSSRPVASGKLTVAQAAGVAGGLAVLSVVGSLLLGPLMASSVLVALVLGWLYSGPPFYLKRRPAGWVVLVIVSGLITYNAGYASNGGGGDFASFVVFSGVMALWMGIIGQTKDLSDVEGDKQAGRRSGPVVWGEDTARVFFAAASLFLGVAYVLSAAYLAPVLLVPALVVTVGAVVLAVVSLGPWSRGDRQRRRRPYRAFMLAQYGANLTVVVC